MASKVIDIMWGPSFEYTLRLNSVYDSQTNSFAYRSKSVDIAGGPEQELIMGETEYSVPFDIRGKLLPRAFSIIVSPIGGTGVTGQGYMYDQTWQTRKHEMFKALYSGLVRVGTQRHMMDPARPGFTKNVYVYLAARCEGIKEVERGVFECAFTAPDPLQWEYAYSAGEVPRSAPTTYIPLPGEPSKADYVVNWNVRTVNTGNPASGTPTALYTPIYLEQPDIPNYRTYVGSAPTDPVITFEVQGVGNVWRYRKEFQVKNNSLLAFHNQMVCIDLGEVLGSGDPLYNKVRSDMGDIRIETFGGARKAIYLRRHDNAGAQNTGDFLKIWFVIHSLAPGETKNFRLLYNNPNATLEAEQSSVKMMFNGYTSTNVVWKFNDFAPRWDQPQSRTHQWVPHVPGRQNLTWLNYAHPDFISTDPLLVNAAAGKTLYHGRGAGYAGLELSTPTRIESITYPVKTRTTWRSPFVQRSQRGDGRWVDDYSNATNTGLRGFASHAHATSDAFVDVTDVWGSVNVWYVGDNVRITLDDGSTMDRVLTAVAQTPSASTTRLSFSGTPSPRNIPFQASVYQGVAAGGNGRVLSSGRTQTFTSGDEPRTVMIGMRVDYPDLTLGDWYYAGSESCDVTFKSAEVTTVKWRTTSPTGNFDGTTFASGYEMDMNTITNGYQLVGRFQNDYDNKGIRINTIMDGVRDRLVIDCENRTCYYYKWQSSTNDYAIAENRYEALYFEEVRDYWLRIAPGQLNAAVKFVHDANSNFRNISATLRWVNKYY